MSATAEHDPLEARRAVGVTGLLRDFNAAGVLSAADVHVAARLGELVGEEREIVRLASAFAVRGPRRGHVFVDLATIRDTASVESEEPVDLSALPWPAVDEWIGALRASPLVARLIEDATASGVRPPLIALAAPTGKAAARLQEAVHAETASLSDGDRARTVLMGLRASTLHRLLGWKRGSHSRFAHDRDNRLPHDVVIVDETSMVSLSRMGRLVEAIRPEAQLILVGDPGQLTSIEAGVVLGDIVGSGTRPGIVVLKHVHRFGGGIARLAEAIRRGEGDGAIAALREATGEITWLEVDVHESQAGIELVRNRAVAAALEVVTAAREGAAVPALVALSRFRLLCAHRRGPHGVSEWTSRVQGWLASDIPDIERRDYVGRPLLVTENDYELGLYNGDTGVIVQDPDGRATAAFERGQELLHFSPLRLGAVDTVYAMTIHKSQGSQFHTAAVLLPAVDSRLLTRELLYTAVTRARRELILLGSEEAVRRAVARPVARASGLGDRLR